MLVVMCLVGNRHPLGRHVCKKVIGGLSSGSEERTSAGKEILRD